MLFYMLGALIGAVLVIGWGLTSKNPPKDDNG
jgi:hypothetical protein